MFYSFFREVKAHFFVIEGDYVEPEPVYEAKKFDNWTNGTGQ